MDNFLRKKNKLSNQDLQLRDKLKNKIFDYLHKSIQNVFYHFDVFKKNISPNISKLKNHFELFKETEENEIKLLRNGILNTHLCLNAQTKLKHTECDSSYTTICVPPQEINKTETGLYNKAEFEINISEDEAIVIPLEIGTTLVYSGYLLTHWQQIREKNDTVKPFVNISFLYEHRTQKCVNMTLKYFLHIIMKDSISKKNDDNSDASVFEVIATSEN